MSHDEHHHCCCCCCGKGKDNKHEQGNNWEEYMKNMTKEELTMKKEKLGKKLAMINRLLEEKE